MDIQSVFERFATLLEERLRMGVFTTEDSLRYAFFLALIQAGYCLHTEVILEEPHPTIPGAKIDLRILQGKECGSTAFEFKFDRAIPSQRHLPSTQKAGAVFKDLFRLARIPQHVASQRYFIYFTTAEMADYFRNPANRLADFYNLPRGGHYSIKPAFTKSQPITFQSVIGDFAIPCEIMGAYQYEFDTKEVLKIFQVIA